MRFAKEGYLYIAVTAVLTMVGFLLNSVLGIIGLMIFIFTVNFFRDPERVTPQAEDVLVSSADGKVLLVETVDQSPYFSFPHRRIAIFMSPFNVHVNRVPMDGTIEKVQYHPGKFFNASLDKASEHNERNAVWVKDQQGAQVAFVQIAGFIARRIVCYAQVGAGYQKGERYGMIKFGSRMEMYFPKEWEPLVQVGQCIKAGETAVVKKK